MAGFGALKSAHKWLVLKRPMTVMENDRMRVRGRMVFQVADQSLGRAPSILLASRLVTGKSVTAGDTNAPGRHLGVQGCLAC